MSVATTQCNGMNCPDPLTHTRNPVCNTYAILQNHIQKGMQNRTVEIERESSGIVCQHQVIACQVPEAPYQDPTHQYN